MSFSSRVKDELVRVLPEARNPRISELSALILLSGRSAGNAERPEIVITTEHSGIARKYFTTLKKVFNILEDLTVEMHPVGTRSHTCTVCLSGRENVERVLEGCRLKTGENGFSLSESRLFIDSACRRAFVRGAFLAAGSLSDPGKFYHLEFVCQDEEKAKLLQDILSSIGKRAGIAVRKHTWVVYYKGSDEIVDVLGYMEAPGALMDLENIRIMKGMKNSVNRQVNCETANINKTVEASVKQVADITYIRDTEGLESLPDNLREMAEVRLQYPDASLKELGEFLDPPVGKSGVNHRLRKLTGYADQLRDRRRS